MFWHPDVVEWYCSQNISITICSPRQLTQLILPFYRLTTLALISSGCVLLLPPLKKPASVNVRTPQSSQTFCRFLQVSYRIMCAWFPSVYSVYCASNKDMPSQEMWISRLVRNQNSSTKRLYRHRPWTRMSRQPKWSNLKAQVTVDCRGLSLFAGFRFLHDSSPSNMHKDSTIHVWAVVVQWSTLTAVQLTKRLCRHHARHQKWPWARMSRQPKCGLSF